MIYIGSQVFTIIKGPLKMLKLKAISNKEIGPYRTDFPSTSHMQFSPAVAEVYKPFVLDDLHYITKKIFNEGYHMSRKVLESLEALAKYYEFEALMAWFARYWEKWEQEWFANQLAIQKKNRPDAEYKNIKLIAKFKDEIMLSNLSEEMKDARISYLENQNTNLSSCLRKMETYFQQLTDRDCVSWWINLYKELTDYEKLAGKYRSNKITIAHLRGKYDDKKTFITDNMIALAKRVPFNKLLKVETVGNRERAICPFHNEKTPSFYIYPDTNRGYCHGCGRSVDTIQYLVEIKKLKFNQAVLVLLSY